MADSSHNKTNDASFIRYHVKGKGDTKQEYASIQKSLWVDGTCKSETVLWLGKVLDKEKLIFKSRQYGIFQLTPPDTISQLTNGEANCYGLTNDSSNSTILGDELSQIYDSSDCLSFGSVFVASELLKQSELISLFTSPFAEIKGLGDAVMSLVLYKLTQCGPSMLIKNWWNGTYAKLLYPNVKLDSPRISELLKEIGKEKYWRIFFQNYSQFIKKVSSLSCVLIDSTGIKNEINANLSQISSQRGTIKKEIRLIIVLDKDSGYPLYFKYVPGNIVDKTTLQHIFHEMDAYDFKVVTSILDAGYYSEENLQFLYDRKVSFITRFIPNLKIFKRIMQQDINDIDDVKYYCCYNNRHLKIKRIQINDIGKMKLYAYICKDLAEANKTEIHILSKLYKNMKVEELADIRKKLRERGIFILLSSIKMPTDKVLQFYYERADIEQIFDFAKNDLNLVPLRLHSESTLRGHFMVVFMATIAHAYIKRIKNKSKKLLPQSLSTIFEILKKHYTEVYQKKNFHLPRVPSTEIRTIYEGFDLEIPKKMLIKLTKN
ncbi:MAG: transposase [Endomicrobium sp.]|jgi:transposase|nr:transposase [Endomicrobium sp.]